MSQHITWHCCFHWRALYVFFPPLSFTAVIKKSFHERLGSCWANRVNRQNMQMQTYCANKHLCLPSLPPLLCITAATQGQLQVPLSIIWWGNFPPKNLASLWSADCEWCTLIKQAKTKTFSNRCRTHSDWWQRHKLGFFLFFYYRIIRQSPKPLTRLH